NAFAKQWRDPVFNICIDSAGIESVIDVRKAATRVCPAGQDQYTMAQYNFSMFWGLAIQAYESTLVSTQNRLDRLLLAADHIVTTHTPGKGARLHTTFPFTFPTPCLFSPLHFSA